MPSDPARSTLVVVAAALAAPFVLVGLVLAVGSPFWAYRSLTSPERRGTDFRRRWLRETAMGEIFAAGISAFGVAIGVMALSPLDFHTMARIELAVAIILGIAGPIVTMRGTITRETFGVVAVRQWLVKLCKVEFVAVYAGIWGALVLLPPTFWARGILVLLQIVSGLIILIEYLHPALADGSFGHRAFQEENNQYLARHGRDSEAERRMQMRMHGGQQEAEDDER